MFPEENEIADRRPVGVATLLAIFAAYVLTGVIGVELSVEPLMSTLVWPPAGIAVAAAALFGLRRTLPTVMAGAIAIGILSSGAPLSSIGDVVSQVLFGMMVGAVACLEAACAAILVRRYAGFPHRLTEAANTAKFLVLAAPVSAVAGATLGPTVLLLAGHLPPEEWVTNAITWWAGDTLGIAIFTPMIAIFVLGPGDAGAFRQYFVAAMLTLLFVAVVALCGHFGRKNRDGVVAMYGATASDLAVGFNNRIGGNLEILRSLDFLRHAVGAMPPENFGAFARLHFQARPELIALSWNEFVTPERRDAVDARLRNNYGPRAGLRRTEDGKDQIVVMMIEPFDRYGVYLGADLLTLPSRADALDAARATGRTAATGNIRFGPNGERNAIVVYRPYFDVRPTAGTGPGAESPGGSPGRLPDGFHGAAFDMDQTLHSVVPRRLLENFFFSVIDDSTETAVDLLMNDDNLRHADKVAVWEFPVRFADRDLRFRVELKRRALENALSRQWPSVIVPGVVIAILLAFLILMGSSRNSEFAALVRAKTLELEYANRRQSEILQRFTESDARLKLTQRIARFGSWEWDLLADEILTYSDECAAIYGMSQDSFRRRVTRMSHLFELVHPDDRADAERDIRSYVARMADGGDDDDEDREAAGRTPAAALESAFRIVRPDGEIRHVSQIAQPEFDAEGRLHRIVGTIHDVTQQRVAADHLRQSEDRLRQATQLAGLGHFIWNGRDRRFQFCSREYARIFGLEIEEFATRISSEAARAALVHPQDRHNYVEERRPLRQGRTVTLAYRALTDRGEIRHVREMIRPVLDAAGELVQEIGVGQDVTSFEQAEEQLRQATKMEALGKLTGGVAHDFNNLLFVVRGNADLLARRLGREDPILSEILVATERATELTRQLLAFSRRQPLSPAPVGPKDLLGRLSNLLRLTLGETIELDMECPEDAWHIMIDRTQLENAVLNVAINARDAMPAGGRLSIRCRNLSAAAAAARNAGLAPGQYVEIAVEDSGTGMSPDVLNRAFEPFFTTKEIGQGSGLGLSMVYGFARQSGGHAEIFSEPGSGTTISLILPRAMQELPPGAPRTVNVPAGNGETVLLVEDDGKVAALTENMLTELGYAPLIAGNADEALGILERCAVDLILSDVALPGGLDGPAFAGIAKAALPDAAIVFMSGYPDDVIDRLGTNDLGAPLLRKPFTAEELGQAIARSLSAAAGNPQETAPTDADY